MARVLCINPWIYDFTAFNQWIEPLGLLMVAGVLREAGHEVTLVDCLDRQHPDALPPRSPGHRFGCGHFLKTELPSPHAVRHVPRRWGRYGIPVEVFLAELKAMTRPDAVLITSVMTYWYPGPFHAIECVKDTWPGVPVALGGVYASLCPEHARTYSKADAVIVGEGEQQAVDWVNAVTGEHRRCDAPVEHIMPAHDLRRRQGYAAIRTAKGCPYSCTYCAAGQLCPGGYIPRPVAAVVDEILWCRDGLGAQDVAFYDDALLVQGHAHLKPILEAVINTGGGVRFHTPNGVHARLVEPSLARLMRQAGFVTIRMGLETADPLQGARDGGKLDREDLERAADALFAAGFSRNEVAVYVLIGRPGQTVESVRETANYAHSMGVQVLAAEYSPVPGTAEWQQAVSAAHLRGDDDPLLHNKAAFLYRHGRDWNRVKIDIRAGNHRVLAAA